VTPKERRQRGSEQRTQRNADMVQAAEDGDTYSEIAQRVGLSLPRTSQILRDHGAPTPTHGKGVKLHLDYGSYRREYEAGATVRELAGAAGISYGAMHRGLAAVDTPFRPRGGRAGPSPDPGEETQRPNGAV